MNMGERDELVPAFLVPRVGTTGRGIRVGCKLSKGGGSLWRKPIFDVLVCRTFAQLRSAIGRNRAAHGHGKARNQIVIFFMTEHAGLEWHNICHFCVFVLDGNPQLRLRSTPLTVESKTPPGRVTLVVQEGVTITLLFPVHIPYPMSRQVGLNVVEHLLQCCRILCFDMEVFEYEHLSLRVA